MRHLLVHLVAWVEVSSVMTCGHTCSGYLYLVEAQIAQEEAGPGPGYEKRRVSLGFSWPKCVVSWWESPWKCCHLERPKQSCVSLLRLCSCTKRVRPFYSRLGKKSCCITVPATPCWRVDRTDLGDFWRFSCNERSWQDAAPTTLVRQVSPQNFDEVLRRAARDGSSIRVYL